MPPPDLLLVTDKTRALKLRHRLPFHVCRVTADQVCHTFLTNVESKCGTPLQHCRLPLVWLYIGYEVIKMIEF
jgi:hypothetical protein